MAKFFVITQGGGFPWGRGPLRDISTPPGFSNNPSAKQRARYTNNSASAGFLQTTELVDQLLQLLLVEFS